MNRTILFLSEANFRAHVRSRIVGASEKLTKQRIVQTIASLTSEDPRWWQTGDLSRLLYARLSILYPGCTDGDPPDRQRKPIAKESVRKGCLHVLVLAALVWGAYGLAS